MVVLLSSCKDSFFFVRNSNLNQLEFGTFIYVERLTSLVRQHSVWQRLAFYYKASSPTGGMGKTVNVISSSRARESKQELTLFHRWQAFQSSDKHWSIQITLISIKVVLTPQFVFFGVFKIGWSGCQILKMGAVAPTKKMNWKVIDVVYNWMPDCQHLGSLERCRPTGYGI